MGFCAALHLLKEIYDSNVTYYILRLIRV